MTGSWPSWDVKFQVWVLGMKLLLSHCLPQLREVTSVTPMCMEGWQLFFWTQGLYLVGLVAGCLSKSSSSVMLLKRYDFSCNGENKVKLSIGKSAFSLAYSTWDIQVHRLYPISLGSTAPRQSPLQVDECGTVFGRRFTSIPLFSLQLVISSLQSRCCAEEGNTQQLWIKSRLELCSIRASQRVLWGWQCSAALFPDSRIPGLGPGPGSLPCLLHWGSVQGRDIPSASSCWPSKEARLPIRKAFLLAWMTEACGFHAGDGSSVPHGAHIYVKA